MKFISLILLILVGTYLSGQTNMNVGVTSEGNELIVSITYDGNIPAGNIGGLPTSNDFISDFTVSIKWPNSANVNLGATIQSSLGAGTISKVGGELIQGSDEYQKFRLNKAVQLPSNLTLNSPYEIFRISFSATNAMTSDMAEIVPQGYLPIGSGGNTQPNTSIDYNGVGDVVDFLPLDIIQAAPLL